MFSKANRKARWILLSLVLTAVIAVAGVIPAILNRTAKAPETAIAAEDTSWISKWDGNYQNADYSWFTANPGATTFTLNSAAQLTGFRNIIVGIYLTDGATTQTFANKTVKLNTDIDFDGKTFYMGASNGAETFLGTFDGGHHTLKNRGAASYGLFATIGIANAATSGITIKNFVLDGITVSGYALSSYGVISGAIANVVHSYGVSSIPVTFENIAVKNAVVKAEASAGTNGSYVGGIVGCGIRNGSYTLTIKNCTYEGNVQAYDGTATDKVQNIGGIAGFSRNLTVEACYSGATPKTCYTPVVQYRGRTRLGALVGGLNETGSLCHTSNKDTATGLTTAALNITIKDSYFDYDKFTSAPDSYWTGLEENQYHVGTTYTHHGVPKTLKYKPLQNGTFAGGSQANWLTTDSLNSLEISASYSTYGIGSPTSGGPYFIEMAASGGAENNNSQIYQVFDTVPGDVYTYSFLYAKRSTGGDVTQKAKVRIGAYTAAMDDSGKAVSTAGHAGSVASRTTRKAALQTLSGANGSVVRDIQTASTAWTAVTGTYTVPTGQTKTVFCLENNIVTAGVGNMIADVKFYSNTNLDAVYFNPVGGNDANSGIAANLAVKTFAHAKTLVAPNAIIYLNCSGAWALANMDYAINLTGLGSNAQLIKSAVGYIAASGTSQLRFDDIIYDGNAITGNMSMLLVGDSVQASSATATINKNVIFRNHKATHSPVIAGKGCTINLKGGTFTNFAINAATNAPAIHIWDGGKFNFYSGEISNIKPTAQNSLAAVHLAGASSVFNMYGGVIKDTVGKGNGGAVSMVDGTFNALGGEISGCSALLGGAIHVSGGTVNLKNSAIKNCTASNGGGIFAVGAKIKINIDAVTIDGCKSTAAIGTSGPAPSPDGGGGIQIGGGALLDIKNSTIKNCTAAALGGGIEVLSDGTKADITNTVIENCTAGAGGGIALNLSNTGVITVSGGEIKGCEATFNNTTYGGGGAVFMTAGTVTLKNSAKITNCKTSRVHGGGIIQYSGTLNLDAVVSGCTAIGSSNSYGGGVYTVGASSVLNVTGGGFSNCQAISGGAIYVASGTANIADVEIKACAATNGGGGGIFATGNNVNLTNAVIEGCTATSGAGIYKNGGIFNITGGVIKGNTAVNGGAMYLNAATTTIDTVAGADNSLEISNNVASGRGGGAIALIGGTLNFRTGTMSGNKATNTTEGYALGGTVTVAGGATFNMSGGVIKEGSSKYGAAIYSGNDTALSSTGGTVNLSGGKIQDCLATMANGGGGVYIFKNSSLNMSGGEISGCNRSAIIIDNAAACVITGGAVKDSSAGASATDATAGNGGGLQIVNSVKTEISGLTITNCKAVSGAGIYNNSSTTVFKGTNNIGDIYSSSSFTAEGSLQASVRLANASQYINITGALTGSDIKMLAPLGTNNKIAQGLGYTVTAADAARFSASGYGISLESNALYLKSERTGVTVTQSAANLAKYIGSSININTVEVDLNGTPGAAITYFYAAKKAGTPSAQHTFTQGMPTNAGEYVIRVDIAASGGYSASSFYLDSFTVAASEAFDVSEGGKTTSAGTVDFAKKVNYGDVISPVVMTTGGVTGDVQTELKWYKVLRTADAIANPADYATTDNLFNAGASSYMAVPLDHSYIIICEVKATGNFTGTKYAVYGQETIVSNTGDAKIGGLNLLTEVTYDDTAGKYSGGMLAGSDDGFDYVHVMPGDDEFRPDWCNGRDYYLVLPGKSITMTFGVYKITLEAGGKGYALVDTFYMEANTYPKIDIVGIPADSRLHEFDEWKITNQSSGRLANVYAAASNCYSTGDYIVLATFRDTEKAVTFNYNQSKGILKPVDPDNPDDPETHFFPKPKDGSDTVVTMLYRGTGESLLEPNVYFGKFAGWYTDEDCTGTKVTSLGELFLQFDGVSILYASWTYDDTYFPVGIMIEGKQYKYEDLADAINEINSGSFDGSSIIGKAVTIELHGNISECESLTLNKDINVDLTIAGNGYTVYGGLYGGKELGLTINSGSVTFEDCNLYNYGITVNNNATLAVDGGEMTIKTTDGYENLRAITVNNGALNLLSGQINGMYLNENGFADSAAVYVKFGTLNYHHDMKMSGNTALGPNAAVQFTGVLGAGEYLIFTLVDTFGNPLNGDTFSPGVVAAASVFARDNYGRVKITNSGITLVKDGMALKSAPSSVIHAMRKPLGEEDPEFTLGYATLAEAIAEAKAGEIVYLVRRISYDAGQQTNIITGNVYEESFTVAKNITLMSGLRMVSGIYSTVVTINDEYTANTNTLKGDITIAADSSLTLVDIDINGVVSGQNKNTSVLYLGTVYTDSQTPPKTHRYGGVNIQELNVQALKVICLELENSSLTFSGYVRGTVLATGSGILELDAFKLIDGAHFEIKSENSGKTARVWAIPDINLSQNGFPQHGDTNVIIGSIDSGIALTLYYTLYKSDLGNDFDSYTDANGVTWIAGLPSTAGTYVIKAVYAENAAMYYSGGETYCLITIDKADWSGAEIKADNIEETANQGDFEKAVTDLIKPTLPIGAAAYGEPVITYHTLQGELIADIDGKAVFPDVSGDYIVRYTYAETAVYKELVLEAQFKIYLAKDKFLDMFSLEADKGTGVDNISDILDRNIDDIASGERAGLDKIKEDIIEINKALSAYNLLSKDTIDDWNSSEHGAASIIKQNLEAMLVKALVAEFELEHKSVLEADISALTKEELAALAESIANTLADYENLLDSYESVRSEIAVELLPGKTTLEKKLTAVETKLFTNEYSDILAKAKDTGHKPEGGDLDDVIAALDAYNALGHKAKAALETELYELNMLLIEAFEAQFSELFPIVKITNSEDITGAHLEEILEALEYLGNLDPVLVQKLTDAGLDIDAWINGDGADGKGQKDILLDMFEDAFEAHFNELFPVVKKAADGNINGADLDDLLSALGYINNLDEELIKKLQEAGIDDRILIQEHTDTLTGVLEKAFLEDFAQRFTVADKDADSITAADLTEIQNAIDYLNSLSDEVKDWLEESGFDLDEWLDGDGQSAGRMTILKELENYAEAEKFIADYSDLLNKDASEITASDLKTIQDALDLLDENGLSDKVKELILDKLGLLDNGDGTTEIDEKIDSLVSGLKDKETAANHDADAIRKAEEFRTDADNAYILNLTTDTVYESDRRDIEALLNELSEMKDGESADDLSRATEQKLAAEKAHLERLLAKLDADDFRNANIDVFNIGVSSVTAEDLAAINRAIADYDELISKNPETAEFLTNEHALLKALRFKAENLDLLNKSLTEITATDLADINSALEAFDDLSYEGKVLLALEKAKLDDLKMIAASDDNANAAADKFKSDFADILNTKTSDITAANIADILEAAQEALDSYNGLGSSAKAKLADELSKLNTLKNAAILFDDAKTAAEDFAQDNSGILSKTVGTVTESDRAAIHNALTDYNALSDTAKAQATAEKTLLEDMKAKLNADKFKSDYAAVLDKSTSQATIADLLAINNAIAAYNNLSIAEKELLTAEKAKLDAMRAIAGKGGESVIAGSVKDKNGNAVTDADVTVNSGNTGIAQTKTDDKGKYNVDGMADGVYNVVIEYDGKTITTAVYINNGEVQGSEITLSGLNINSIVDVKAGAPDVVVDGLDRIAANDTCLNETEKQIAEDGGSANLKLTVDNKDNSDIKAERGKEIGFVVDITITKTVLDKDGNIVNTDTLSTLAETIAVIIPLAEEYQNKSSYVVYRMHGGQRQLITQSNINGEYFKVSDDGTYLIVYTKNFSAYAVGFDAVKERGCAAHWILLALIILYMALALIFALRRSNDLLQFITWSAYVIGIVILTFFMHWDVLCVIFFILAILIAIAAIIYWMLTYTESGQKVFIKIKNKFVKDEDAKKSDEDREAKKKEKEQAKKEAEEEKLKKQQEEKLAKDTEKQAKENEKLAKEQAKEAEKQAKEQELREKLAAEKQNEEEQERLEEERLARIAAEKKAAAERQAALNEEEAAKAELLRAEERQAEIAAENLKIRDERTALAAAGAAFKLSREDVLDRIDEMASDIFDYPVSANVRLRATDSSPDTLRAGVWAFAVMYESKAEIIKFIVRLDDTYAKALKDNHPSIEPSKFSGTGDWFKIIIDLTFYSKKEVFSILDNSYLYVLKNYVYDAKKKKYVTDEVAAAKDDSTVVSELLKEAAQSDEALTLAEKAREELDLRLLTARSFETTKREITAYIQAQFENDIEITEREQFSSTGLPLANTMFTPHGISDKGKKQRVCFAYVYQLKDNSIKIIAKLPKIYAERQAKTHTNLCRSKFPAGKNWYSTIVDSSYKSADDIHGILNRAKAFVESSENRD